MKKTVLSVGDVIVPNSGDKVTIGKKLGEGATASVYRATLIEDGVSKDIVVKAAKPGMETLLKGEWEAINKMFQKYRLDGKDLVAPTPRGEGKHNEVYYIVMEYLSGPGAFEILLNGTDFHEKQVLKLAVQLFEFLEIMHTELKVSYPDFKFDDLRLEKTSGTDPDLKYRLRIWDLGGLQAISSPEDARAKKDILVGGVYLFTLISGNTLQLMGGELTEEVETALKTNFFQEKVSWGTRLYFECLLCRVPEFRLSSAKQAVEKVRELDYFWVVPEKNLFGESVGFSEQAENAKTIEKQNEFRAKARMELDVFVRRNKDTTPGVSALLEQAEKGYEATSYFIQGLANLRDAQNAQYEKAITTFQLGEVFESRPSFFRRWRYLAQWLKQAQDPSCLSAVQKISVLFEKKDFKAVSAELALLPNTAEKEKSLLLAEANIYSAYEAGFAFMRARDYPSAIKEFEQVAQRLAEFSPKDQIAITKEHKGEENTGDPQKLIEVCKELETELQKFKDFQNDFDELKDKFSKGDIPLDDKISQFALKGKYASDLSKHAAELLGLALDKSDDFEKVSFIAEYLYWPVPNKTEQLRSLYRAVRVLDEAKLNIDIDLHEEFLSALNRLIDLSKKDPQIAAHLINHNEKLLWDAVEKLSSNNNKEFWAKLKGMLRDISLPVVSATRKGKSLSEDLDARLKALDDEQRIKDEKQRINRTDLFNKIETFLYPAKLDQARLQAYIQSFSRLDIKEFFTNNKKRLENAENYLEVAKKEFSEENFEKQQKELDRQKKWFISAEETLPTVSIQSLQNKWGEIKNMDFRSDPQWEAILFKLMEDCLNFFGNGTNEGDIEIRDIMAQCKKKIAENVRMGWDGGRALINYQKTQTEKLETAKNLFEQGNLDRALESFNELSPEVSMNEKGIKLYILMLQTKTFENSFSSSQIKNAMEYPPRKGEVLTWLKPYIPLHIPKIYYKNHKIDEYLMKLGDQAGFLKLMGFEENKGQDGSGMSFNWNWLFLPVGALILILVTGFLYFLWIINPPPVSPTAAPIAAASISTPTPIPPTPTYTIEPSPTIPPTPLPTSAYIVDQAAVDPKLYVNDQTVWELPAFKPCLDVTITPVGASQAQSETSLCTSLDAPIEIGKYSLYLYYDLNFMDVNTAQPKLDFKAQILSADGTNMQTPILPSLGLAQIQIPSLLDLQAFARPYPKLQMWIGMFDVQPAGTFNIRISFSGDSNTLKFMQSGVPVLHLVKMKENLYEKLPTIEKYKLVNILDLSNLFGVKNSAFQPVSPKALTPAPASDFVWDTSTADLTDNLLSSGILSVGDYKMLYHAKENKDAPLIQFFYGSSRLEKTKLTPSSTQNNTGWSEFDFSLRNDGQLIIESIDPKILPSFDVILIYKKQ